MIIAGGSAIPRTIDFGRMRQIADSVGAYMHVDMAHFAGLVAAGLFPSVLQRVCENKRYVRLRRIVSRDELLDELGVVQHFIIPAEFGILVFECIEAVWTPGYDALDTVSVEDSDVLGGLHLKKKLITCSFGWIPCTTFLSSQNGKADARVVQNFRHCFGDLFCTIVKATGTTDPKQDFRSLAFGSHLC